MGLRLPTRLSANNRTRAGRKRLGYGVQVYEFYIVPKDTVKKSSEYFCCRCRQLRLSLIADKSRCQNCGSKDIIVGPCGSLDKAALIRKMDGLTE